MSCNLNIYECWQNKDWGKGGIIKYPILKEGIN